MCCNKYLLIILLISWIITIVFGQQNNVNINKYNNYPTRTSINPYVSNYRITNRYRLITTTNKPPTYLKSKKNQNNNDGRYIPEDDGRYHPSDDGKYIHIGDKDNGAYNDNAGKYVHQDVGGGQYIHQDVGGGQYIGEHEPKYKDTTTSGPLYTYIYEQTTKPTLKMGTGTGEAGGGFRILHLVNSSKKEGYHYLYETQNGILAEESGRVEELSKDEEGLRSKGFYEYTGDDGLLYRVDYTADDGGFIPDGDHIPKTPSHVKRLLEYLSSKNLL